MSSDDFAREGGGEFSESASRQDILLVFDRLADEEPLTTAEVAEELPIGRRALHDRLEKMHRDGDLGKKDFGNRVVWWAEVAPELDPELADELDATADEDEYLSMDELDDRLHE
ncbi:MULTISPECIES: helix-turn-helix transcriptional regulator [Halolamina]|uniref:Uncharacterized protein n=1 Tax=Halolamina pelagica TaxID=699431 RepID=A0A1I5NGE9_9EURY|nr:MULTISPECIES: helix-turn-helix transcriptional regulator [Halolamina]NHX36301.1 helix-turn-helix transcriptional regulator [Halolamina sp. R1-12]SFP20873.1 hypothetical protein SAMN05216277_10212 [Halolamina pelagica]